MINEIIHFQYATGKATAILQYSFFQSFHYKISKYRINIKMDKDTLFNYSSPFSTKKKKYYIKNKNYL